MAQDWRAEHDFDSFSAEEKAWPIYALFTLFMVYFAVASSFLFDFDHELWYFNAWVYLIVGVVGWMVGMACIPLLDKGSVRRGIQISIVLSLILHLSMFLGIVAINIGDVANASLNPNAEEQLERKPVVVPDYSPTQINQDPETETIYETPVETDDAKPEVDPLEQEKIEHEQPQMQENEVTPDKLPSEIQPEQIEKRQQDVAQPKQPTLDQLPSELNKQSREQQQQPTTAEQIEVQRQEQQQPSISAADAQAQRSAQALEMQRQANNIQSAVQRTTQIQRRQTQESLPDLTSSAARSVERQQVANQNPGQTAAQAAQVQELSPAQVQAQARAAQMARQESQQPTRQPINSANTPATTQMASSMALNRNSTERPSQIAPEASPTEIARTASANQLPNIETSVADNLPRPSPGRSESSQLQAASGSVARRDVGGDGVEANALNRGQLWARPDTSSNAAQMREQHGATRSATNREDGITASELRTASIGRRPSTGAQAVNGPSSKIQYVGPSDGNQSAANADALASGQFSAPSMNVGRTADNGANEIGGGQVQAADVSTPGASVGTDYSAFAQGTSRRGDAGQSLQEFASSKQGLPNRRKPGQGPEVGTTAQADTNVPGLDSMRPDRRDIAGNLPGVGSVPEIQRRNVGGPALPIGRPGVGDLAGTPNPTAGGAGFVGRRRTADAPQITTSTSNLPVRSPGRSGPLLSTRAAVPTEAFSRRSMRIDGEPGDNSSGPTRETEEAIELGLAFLARHQSANGRWSLREFAVVKPENYPVYQEELKSRLSLQSDTAATGLALLAFLGAGYNHLDDQYQKQVNAGIQFLVQNQKPSGDLYVEMDDDRSDGSCRLYSHGIAALALCEAYGMTQDERLREPAQRSLDFIAAAQDRNLGGWRYTPGRGSDTSVTGWMTLSLKSGQLAGLQVDPRTFEGIRKWLASAESRLKGRAVYVYDPNAPDTKEQRHGRVPSQTMTAVGALIQLYLGNRRDSKVLRDSAEFLKENLPAIGTPESPLRDTYYWYYATQVMFHMRGEYWEAWDNELHGMLERTQVREGPAAGSWDPNGQVPDRWGPFAGRIYVTTMNLLSLEVYHRHLPIYDDVGK